MGYSNSSLVDHTKLSPNNSGTRTHAIDRITPHCVVGQCTAEWLGSFFAKSSTQASSNYGIDKNGRVGLYVEESKRSWCSSSSANDQRAVTIECASDTSSPYKMNDAVYSKLIELCTDICKRNGKTKLVWIDDKTEALAYSVKSNEMLLTVHRWFKNKSCPGDWLYSRLGDVAAKVTSNLASGSTKSDSASKDAGSDDKTSETPFKVRVSTSVLNIRKGPGTNYGKTGSYTGRGVFTITEIQNGSGSKTGWGKLKSGAGWISLDYTKRV